MKDHEASFTYSVRCECDDCAKTMASLRTLRLWHWERVIDNRTLANTCTVRRSIINANKTADFHMKFVQTLNDFFPEGDTAEKDAAK